MSTLCRAPAADHRADASGPRCGATCDPAGIGQAPAGGHRSQLPGRGATRALARDPGLDRRDAARVAPPQRGAPRARELRRADPA